MLCCNVVVVKAQDLLKGKDLSQVKVDMLSDADIAKFKNQLYSSGMTLEQAGQLAISKGMTASEFEKLKLRVNAAGVSTGTNNKSVTNDTERKSSTDSVSQTSQTKKPSNSVNPLIFGSELYAGVAPSFEPNSNIATPVNYIIGPSDVISVTVYGIQQYDGELTVSAEGSISIPSVGILKVAGMTLESATEKIKSVMGNTAYPYLKSGGAKISVTIGKIKTIRVTIIGSNQPGNYNLSSLTTLFNALYVAGGPSQNGSFREIELIRNNKVFKKIDLYKFLLFGDQSDNIGLKDNDLIRIPPYKRRLEITGQVRRPGIFEFFPDESFAKILEFASGFTDTAYVAGVKVFQKGDKERKVIDLAQAEYVSYFPKSGDNIVVSKLLNRFENRISIAGAVFRPDVYELTSGLRISDLIRKAEGLKENAFMGRALVFRLLPDFTRSVYSFDLSKIISNPLDTINNIRLVREDEVIVSSINELTDTMKVNIQGEVRMSGTYDYVTNLTLKDLILQAGGFTDAAYKTIEISRMIKRDIVSVEDIKSANLITVEIDGDLQSPNSNIKLSPNDVVVVRRKAGYQSLESVSIVGMVQFPGPYTLSIRSERVSSIFKRAGGALPDADLSGAYIRRTRSETEIKMAEESLKKIKNSVKDTTVAIDTDGVLNKHEQIPLDLQYIINNPGSTMDMILKENDEIIVPKYDAQVKISGFVSSPTIIPFQNNLKLTDYISAAGGFNGRGWKGKVYVVYNNGKAAATKHFLFFKKYPKVLPGSNIVVPMRPDRKGISTGEIIGLTSGVASLAGLVIAILKL